MAAQFLTPRRNRPLIQANTRQVAQDSGFFNGFQIDRWLSRRFGHGNPEEWTQKLSPVQSEGIDQEVEILIEGVIRTDDDDDKGGVKEFSWPKKISIGHRVEWIEFYWGRDQYHGRDYTTREPPAALPVNRAAGDLGIGVEVTPASDALEDDPSILQVRDHFGPAGSGHLASRVITPDLIQRLREECRPDAEGTTGKYGLSAAEAAERAYRYASQHYFLTPWLLSEHVKENTEFEWATRIKVGIFPKTWDPVQAYTNDFFRGHAEWASINPILLELLNDVRLAVNAEEDDEDPWILDYYLYDSSYGLPDGKEEADSPDKMSIDSDTPLIKVRPPPRGQSVQGGQGQQGGQETSTDLDTPLIQRRPPTRGRGAQRGQAGRRGRAGKKA